MKLFDKTGSLLFELNIAKEINSGGEGAIYQGKPGEVVKIYHSHIQASINERFLQELSALNSSFIKPLGIYYSSNGKVVGFPMKYLDTKKLSLLTDLSNKTICMREGYDEAFKIKVLNNIIYNVSAAHDKGVVIGDLNPYNIFFSKSGEVFFIDTDSYQTASKKHSGTMLPEIRDWLTHEINEKTDNFSFAVLSFHATTYLHPYKGIHPKYKSIEERVVKHLSVLSGDKDLKLPAFYQPITSTTIVSQFKSIFQDDNRFAIDITGVNVAKAVQPGAAVAVTNSKLLSVKILATDVTWFDAEGGMLVFMQKAAVSFATMPAHGTVGKIEELLKTKERGLKLFAFENGIIRRTDNNRTLHLLGQNRAQQIQNFWTTNYQYYFRAKNHLVVFDSYKDSCTVLEASATSASGIGLNMASEKTDIFVPSVTVKDGVAIQSIGGKKWLLMVASGRLVTIRTDYDIRDAYAVEDKLCLQIKVGNRIKQYLAKLNGMKIELGAELPDMRSFAIVGTNLFVPEDGQIDVYSGLTLTKVQEIECKYVNAQSVLKSTRAGILCHTDQTLYLLNKS